MDNAPLTRIGFIFEGSTDQVIITTLVEKLLERKIDPIPLQKEADGIDDFRRRKRGGNPALDRAWGMFKSYIIALLIEDAHAIIVVVDNDGDQPPGRRWCLLARNLPFDGYAIQLVDVSDLAARCDEMGLALNLLAERITNVHREGSVPVMIGVAVEMLEAWLLAQPHIVESVLWEPLSDEERARCAAPEQIAHPKNEMVRPHNGRSGLSQAQAKQIAAHPEFAPRPIEGACPSFARFADDVRVLSTRAAHDINDRADNPKADAVND